LIDLIEMLSNRFESRLYPSGEERYYINRKRVSANEYADKLLTALHEEMRVHGNFQKI